MKKMWNIVLAMWRPILLGVIVLALLSAVMFYRLGSLTPGLSEPEIISYKSASSLRAIVDNAVNAPYKLAVFISNNIIGGAAGLRIVSASIGILAAIVFYAFARKLCSPRVAVLISVLFATTSMLLHSARLGTGEVMVLSILALVATGYVLRFGRRPDIAWPITAAILAVSLYVPGMVIFIIPAIIWQFREVRKSFEGLKPWLIATTAAVFSIIIAPLVISLIREPVLYRGYLGLPATLPEINSMLREAAIGLSSIFVMAPVDPVRWLGRQPALDVFVLVLFVYGFFAGFRYYKLERFWVLLGIFLLTTIWIGLSANRLYALILLPFVYLVAGYGLDRLLGQWLDVFPRNPIARNVGIVLVIAAVLLAANYQLQRYFVAWPNNLETKAVFQQSLPPQ